jgi:hypothetical protein
LAIVFKEQFTGFCPYCDKSTLKKAEYCHHCGKSLFHDPAHTQSLRAPLSTAALNTLVKETSQVFLIWCCCISLLGSAALINYFYHSFIPIIIATVAFVYAQIFFTAKLDELSTATKYSPQPIAFISLLLPVIGSIFCYQRLTHLAYLETQRHSVA